MDSGYDYGGAKEGKNVTMFGSGEINTTGKT